MFWKSDSSGNKNIPVWKSAGVGVNYIHCISVPGQPYQLTISVFGPSSNLSVLVKWKNPFGGDLVDEYIIELRQNGLPWYEEARVNYISEQDQYTIVITNLLASNAYEVRVYAVNSAGKGMTSQRSTVSSKHTTVYNYVTCAWSSV